jgi:hypothetical protein
MGRFNPSNYDPRTESTEGHEVEGRLVVVVPTSDSCRCGCLAEVAGKKSLFRMGHDARLRGRLMRAHLAGVRVTYKGFNVSEDLTAMEFAGQFDSPNYSWTGALETAQAKHDAAASPGVDAANRELVKKATGPQVGDNKLVKVGRWEYTGQVAAIFDDGDVETLLVEYVTRNGETKSTRIPATKEA